MNKLRFNITVSTMDDELVKLMTELAIERGHKVSVHYGGGGGGGRGGMSGEMSDGCAMPNSIEIPVGGGTASGVPYEDIKDQVFGFYEEEYPISIGYGGGIGGESAIVLGEESGIGTMRNYLAFISIDQDGD